MYDFQNCVRVIQCISYSPYATFPTGWDVRNPRVPGNPWGGGGAPLLSNPGDDDQINAYFAGTINVRHFSASSPADDGGSGGGGEGNADGAAKARMHESAIGAPEGYFADSVEDSIHGDSPHYGGYLWNEAMEFLGEAWDSPLGIAAGIAVAVGTVAALTIGAPLTIGILCGALAAGAVAGTITNLVVGAGDVFWRESGHRSWSDHVSPEVHNHLRLGRDIYQWAGVLGEAGILSGKLALGLARGGTKLGLGGFSSWWKRGGGSSANLALRKYSWFWERPAAIPANWDMKLGKFGNGLVVRDPSGKGNIFRYMDPRKKPYAYPKGYYRIQNSAGDYVDCTGQGTSNLASSHFDAGKINLRYDIKFPWQ